MREINFNKTEKYLRCLRNIKNILMKYRVFVADIPRKKAYPVNNLPGYTLFIA